MTRIAAACLGFAIVALVLLAGCEVEGLLKLDDLDAGDDNDDNPTAPATVAGLNFARSRRGVNASYDFARDRLAVNANVQIVAQVDYRARALDAGLSLRPTRLLLFANPSRAAPLMQAEPAAGLDLPQKLLVYRHGDGDGDGEVIVAYNDPAYLRARYGISGRDDVLDAMDSFLTMLVQDTAGNAVTVRGPVAGVSPGEGIVELASGNDFATTTERLRDAIIANPDLRLITVVDHQANAARVGLGLNPNTLFVFGNPQRATVLLQSSQTIGIDLPQKILVYQTDAGAVRVAYNDPDYLAARHGIEAAEETLQQIDATLDELATRAAL